MHIDTYIKIITLLLEEKLELTLVSRDDDDGFICGYNNWSITILILVC